MQIIANAANRRVRDVVSPVEWQTRVALAACYRLIAHYGMTDLIYNHVTARVPGPGHEILINPYGYLYQEITASCLYKIDLAGNVLLQPDVPYGVNHPGYVIHSAVHAAREDVGCVIHTHTRATVAVSMMKEGLMSLSQTAMRFHGRVGYHDYEGPASDLHERERLAAHLGSCDVMLLRHHGALAVGRTIAEAFNIMYFLEMACRIQVDAMAAGRDHMLLPSAESVHNAERFLGGVHADPNHGTMDGSREWPAMLRLLDRVNPGYDQ